MKIRFLGAHNTETSRTGLMCLLVDGRLALDAGCLTSRLSLAEQLDLKAVLFTHAHYDHVRDLPMLCMNAYLNDGVVHAYGSQAVRDALAEHFFNGSIYSRFFDKPALDFHIIQPNAPFTIGSYEIKAVPVNHAVPATGFELKSEGRSFFYTGDTGPGLAECWHNIAPGLLIIEVTASNRFTDFGRDTKHMTPELLQNELVSFREVKGYLPQVVTVHMNPSLELEIADELGKVVESLGADITLGWEGREISL